MTTGIQAELPPELLAQARAFVEEGWATDVNELLAEALRRSGVSFVATIGDLHSRRRGVGIERMTSYDEILESAKRLSSEQRQRLADALLALEQLGNGKTSLEDFERDMDLVAQGLDHLPAEYQGDYSREDIYSDHD